MMLAGVQPDTVTYNLALKACEAPANTTLAPGLLDTAFGLLHGMTEQSVAPDVMTYTTILGAVRPGWRWLCSPRLSMRYLPAPSTYLSASILTCR